jgi:cell wall-associated NlpC family hydrolase
VTPALAAAVAAAPPAQVAQANQLAEQITTQSAILDQLSDQYNKAAEQAMAASQRLAGEQTALAAAQTNVSEAQTRIGSAQQSLHDRALAAYLGHTALPGVHANNVAEAAYQLRIAHVYGGTALESTNQQINDLHGAVHRLQDNQQQVQSSIRLALVDNATAWAAEQRAQAAQAAAQVAQAKLLATQQQVQGELVTLVAAQRASVAQTAYNQISQSGKLLFNPSTPLPGALTTTAAVINIALAQQGKPYVWGGTGPDVFDCSGLMQWAWAQLGVHIPRVASDQQAWATPVPISQVQPGDLVFFGNPAHHVGMYIGNGQMVDAPHTGAFVEVTSIWWNELAGFGRVHG